MSYRCEICKKQQKPGTKQLPLTTRTRPVEYREIRSGVEVHVGYGGEIAKEIKVCPTCYEDIA